MLTVEQTFETQGADQNVPNESGGTDPYATVTTRKISSDVSVENRQTVVMGGLTKKTQTESESGVPILKDIPWIGKWLFGSVNMTDKRSELLVFMTPYVLDDAESAQAEAIRRKKALSDSRPWEDEGWSASPLADPVSKKEQLRRFKDEWKKQDEERKTKLAIEKAKMDRARKLEAMSEEERKAWIEIHKDELDKEAREAFEKKVEEQKDLKDFVEQLKKQDLEKSEKALKAAKEESDK
jgi:type II secretory pathway component GspD/PulD (secretin)